jgi:large subunit ribosomal protein L6
MVVSVEQQDKKLQVKFDSAGARMTAGATRAHIANMVLGVSKGYERKLELVGRRLPRRGAGQGAEPHARLLARGELPDSGRHLDGMPEPDLKSSSRASTARRSARWPPRSAAIRPPEPYKGKGVRYTGEKIELKEGKKK